MPTKFNMTKDIAGYNGFGVVPSQDKQSTLLIANTAETSTVPTEYPTYLAIFSYTPGSNVFVDFSGTTATAPSSGSFTATTAELNPQGRQVNGGQIISVMCPDTNGAYVQISYYVVGRYIN